MPLSETKLDNEGDTAGSEFYECIVGIHCMCTVIHSIAGSDEDDALWMDSMGINQECATIVYPIIKNVMDILCFIVSL